MNTVTQTLYCIQATVAGRQVPTFYLDSQVQGIMNSVHAERIARSIVTGCYAIDSSVQNVHIAVMEVNYEIAPWGEYHDIRRAYRGGFTYAEPEIADNDGIEP